MRIAVISDIHGNLQALEAVMKDIEEQKCSKVFCLGDIAMAGPQPRMVIDFISNQKDWIIIQGNTDKLISDFTPEIFKEVGATYPIMAEALMDDILYIENERKEFLKNLPEQKSFKINGVKVLLVHGSPRRNNEDILPNLPIEEVEEMIAGTNADLILCGHTHIPCGYQTNTKQTVINAGSVGRPMTTEPKACYVIIDFQDGTFTAEHRFIDYDYQLAATILSSRDYKGADKIAQLLINPISRHL